MVPELRPRSVGEVLDAAVALYRAKFWPLMAATCVVVLPVAALTLLVQLSALPDDYDAGLSVLGPSVESDTSGGQLAAMLVTFLLTGLATAFVTAAATRIVADAYIRHSEPTARAVRNVARRMGSIAGLTVVVTLGTFAGMLACIIPGLVLQAVWSIAVPALILEGTRVFAALGRAFRLAQARFWLVLGVFWLTQLLITALSGGVVAALEIALLDRDAAHAQIVGQAVANTFASIVLTPFVATAVVALYFDLRIRAEAFDVQMMIASLDARPAAAPGAMAR